MPDRRKRPAEGRDRRAVLDRIPERIDAARPAPMRLRSPSTSRSNSPSCSKGGSTRTKAALFLGRQMRAERQPAVEFDDPNLEIAGKQRLQAARHPADAVRSPTAGPAFAADAARSSGDPGYLPTPPAGFTALTASR